MKLLIAIVTCHRFRERANVLRRTWIPDVRSTDAHSVDVRFFLGHGGNDGPQPDEVFLDIHDDYKSLRRKTQLVFKWSVEHEYDFTFKTDDDVYVIPDRLLKNFIGRDYCGRLRPASQENDAARIYGKSEAAFCSGFGYWVSRHAAQIVADAPDNTDWAEDRFAGNALALAGVYAHHDVTLALWPPLTGHACAAPLGRCSQCLRVYEHASVVCPYARPSVIEQLHEIFKRTGSFPTVLRP